MSDGLDRLAMMIAVAREADDRLLADQLDAALDAELYSTQPSRTQSGLPVLEKLLFALCVAIIVLFPVVVFVSMAVAQ